MIRIKELREKKGLKQAELSKIIGVNQKTLSNYENERTNADYDILIKLSRFFDVSIDYLLGNSNNPEKENFTKDLTEEEVKELKRYKELLEIKKKIKNNHQVTTLSDEE
jgi:transcriptional regulator with XRE-family HTH domain